MSTLILLSIFIVSFIKVAARSFQQLNVVRGRFFTVIPVSYVMAFSEIFVTGYGAAQIVSENYTQAALVGLVYGTGGWMGCWLSMWADNKMVRK